MQNGRPWCKPPSAPRPLATVYTIYGFTLTTGYLLLFCRSVQATFRSEAGGWLHALSDHFSAVLGRLLNTNFS